ncbi:DUF935 domain-containing protein [Salmonella enterica]|nr:DUF935 domain-containing protein [Salmonella enterica]
MGKIVDINGQPFAFTPDMQTTAEDIPQVASRDPMHLASGLTPNRAAACLRAAEQGDLTAQADLAADMEEKDTHLFAELGKRRLSVLSVPWNIVTPEGASADEKREAAMLEDLLGNAAWFEPMLFNATDAVLKGYAMQEIEWGWCGKYRFPVDVHWRDPALFILNPVNKNELRLSDGSYEGLALQPFGWIRHQARSKSGYAGAQGLVRTLIWPFIFKNYSLRDFAEFLEIYGLPLRVGKYPSGATKEQKAALMRAVMDIGRRAGGIIPAGMSLDFEAAADGQSEPFLAMMNWGEKAMSKAILGSTLTTQTDTNGNRSLGEVHDEVRKEIRDADLRQLAATFNRDLLYPLLALNRSQPLDMARLPRFRFDTMEPEDMAMFADAIPKLAAGLPISCNWIYEKLRIPAPQKNEAVFTVQPPQPVQPEAALSAQVLLSPSRDELDDMGDHVDPALLQDAMSDLLAPLVTALHQHGPVQALQDAAGLFPHLDDAALTELLTRAVFAAELKGRTDAIHD